MRTIPDIRGDTKHNEECQELKSVLISSFICISLPGAFTDDKYVIISCNPTVYEPERMEVPNKTIQTPSRKEWECRY
jgi:hypothetical protein